MSGLINKQQEKLERYNNDDCTQERIFSEGEGKRKSFGFPCSRVKGKSVGPKPANSKGKGLLILKRT